MLSLTAPHCDAAVSRADHVHAELLHDVAADFGDRDLQRDLVVANDVQQVDDLADAALLIGVVDGDTAVGTAACGGL